MKDRWKSSVQIEGINERGSFKIWDLIEVDIDKERLYQKYREYKGKGYDFKDYV